MPDFHIGKEGAFTQAWDQATRDGRVDPGELKKLEAAAKTTDNTDDDALVAHLKAGLEKTKDGSPRDTSTVTVHGSATTRLDFAGGAHTHASVRIAPEDVTEENVGEFILQREQALDDYAKELAANKDPDFVAKMYAKRAEIDAEYDRALKGTDFTQQGAAHALGAAMMGPSLWRVGTLKY